MCKTPTKTNYNTGNPKLQGAIITIYIISRLLTTKKEYLNGNIAGRPRQASRLA
jgi:hypothetical protein